MPPANTTTTPGISERAASTEGLMRHLDFHEFIRPRRVSERSEAAMSDAESHSQLPYIKRKKILQRAMTDAAYLAAGLQQQSSIQNDDHDVLIRHPVVEALNESKESLSKENSSDSGGDVDMIHEESKENTSREESDAGKIVGEVRILFNFK